MRQEPDPRRPISRAFRLDDAQSCIAREYGFASWARLFANPFGRLAACQLPEREPVMPRRPSVGGERTEARSEIIAPPPAQVFGRHGGFLPYDTTKVDLGWITAAYHLTISVSSNSFTAEITGDDRPTETQHSFLTLGWVNGYRAVKHLTQNQNC